MKKILFISSEYPKETGTGGIGTYVFNMARALKDYDKNFHVTVLSVSPKSSQKYQEDGIEVVRLKIGKFNPLGIHLAFARWLAKNYKYYNLIEDQTFGGYIFFAKLILGKKLKYVARLHGTSHEVRVLERITGIISIFRNRVANFFERYITKKADIIIADSSLLGIYSFMMWNIDFGRSNSLPLPYDFNYINQGKFDQRIEKIGDREYLLFYGRIQKKKGSQVMEKIIEKALERYPNIGIVIFGSDKIGLVNRYKDNSRVIHIDHVFDRDMMYSIVKRAKIVILPSQFEAFLYTAVEAISLGVPTIVSRNCGVVEFIDTSGMDSVVNNFNDSYEYMEKIKLILDDYDSALAHTRKQKEKLELELNPGLIVNKYIDMINKNPNITL